MSLGAKPSGIAPAAKAEVRAKLQEILQAPANPTTGRLKLRITTMQYFPIFTAKTEGFTMWLLPDRAYCLEDSLNRFFEIDRESLRGKQFTGQIVAVEDRHAISRMLELESASLQAFNEWLRVG